LPRAIGAGKSLLKGALSAKMRVLTKIDKLSKHEKKRLGSQMGDENMKRNYLILVLLAVGCVLFLQIGCQEQARVAEGPETAPPDSSELSQAAPEPAVLLREESQGQPEREPTLQEPKVEAAPQIEKGTPKIVFDKAVHDFGKVGPVTKNVGEFKITNAGDGLLEITKIGQCCGVVTKLSKKKYAPGESGVLTAAYRSTRLPAVIRRQLVVHSNDKAKPEFTLTLKAEVVPKVACDPKRLRLFLNEENAGCPEITLSSLDEQPFSITAFSSTADCITADTDDSVKATKFALKAKVDMEKLQKNLKGRITIGLTHPQCNTLTVLYDVLPKFTINPPLIIVFNAEPQKPITRKVSVLNNYSGDCEIESVSSKADTIKVLSQEKIRNGYQFEVEITPPAAEGATQFTDVLFINIKGQEKLEITCRGFYSTRISKTQ
jgi:hypothetical protein